MVGHAQARIDRLFGDAKIEVHVVDLAGGAAAAIGDVDVDAADLRYQSAVRRI